MKKILMFIVILISFLYSENYTNIKHPYVKHPETNPIMHRCVNVVDVSCKNEILSIIGTKIKGKSAFENIQIFCPIIKIYDISIVNNKDEKIGNVKRIGIFLFPKFDKISRDARYKITFKLADGKIKTEYSKDHFCIRPYTFTFDVPNSLKEGRIYKINYNAIDFIGNKTSYNNIPSIKGNKMKYSIYPNYIYASFKNGKHSITLYDYHYCDIDKNDTPLDIREIYGKTDLNVGESSKYWGGISTGEDSNKPSKNTINVNIKQNTFQDMRFKKIQW